MPGKSVAHADQTSFLVAIIEAKYLGLGISVLSQTVAKLAATVILCGRISQNSGLAERGHCNDLRRDPLSASSMCDKGPQLKKRNRKIFHLPFDIFHLSFTENGILRCARVGLENLLKHATLLPLFGQRATLFLFT